MNGMEHENGTIQRWQFPFRGNANENGHENGSRLPRNFHRRYAHIVGWGMEVPERVLTNQDLEAIVETNDEWIVTRTGISERRIADERESTGQLALRAAQQALKVANILPTEVDLVIVATSTPEHIFPSTASQVQDWLGAKHAGAFDLSAACSGFVYALDMAAAKIRGGDIDTAVIIGAETMSRVLNWSDRGTCILFGDGAGAVVLSGSDEPGGILSSTLRSDGAGWDMLGLPTVGSRDTYLMEYQQSHPHDDDDKEVPRLMHRLHMNGRDVFRFAAKVIPESIKDVVKAADLELDNVDLIIPHQANQRIIEAAARNMKIPIEKFYSNVKRYGNTSAASIPIALCEAIEEGKVNVGNHLVFCGFGGGLAWGTLLLRWEEIPERRNQRIMSARQQATYWYANQRRKVLKSWRTLARRVGGSPTPNATMKQLRERLAQQEEEEIKP